MCRLDPNNIRITMTGQNNLAPEQHGQIDNGQGM